MEEMIGIYQTNKNFGKKDCHITVSAIFHEEWFASSNQF